MRASGVVHCLKNVRVSSVVLWNSDKILTSEQKVGQVSAQIWTDTANLEDSTIFLQTWWKNSIKLIWKFLANIYWISEVKLVRKLYQRSYFAKLISTSELFAGAAERSGELFRNGAADSGVRVSRPTFICSCRVRFVHQAINSPWFRRSRHIITCTT